MYTPCDHQNNDSNTELLEDLIDNNHPDLKDLIRRTRFNILSERILDNMFDIMQIGDDLNPISAVNNVIKQYNVYKTHQLALNTEINTENEQDAKNRAKETLKLRNWAYIEPFIPRYRSLGQNINSYILSIFREMQNLIIKTEDYPEDIKTITRYDHISALLAEYKTYTQGTKESRRQLRLKTSIHLADRIMTRIKADDTHGDGQRVQQYVEAHFDIDHNDNSAPYKIQNEINITMTINTQHGQTDLNATLIEQSTMYKSSIRTIDRILCEIGHNNVNYRKIENIINNS